VGRREAEDAADVEREALQRGVWGGRGA
jgi:hypothetical protein